MMPAVPSGRQSRYRAPCRRARRSESAWRSIGPVFWSIEGETSVARMARPFEDLIDWLGRDNQFPNGVILLTGTGIVPPDEFSLEAGDEVRITIDGVGTLSNPVIRGEVVGQVTPIEVRRRTGRVPCDGGHGRLSVAVDWRCPESELGGNPIRSLGSPHPELQRIKASSAFPCPWVPTAPVASQPFHLVASWKPQVPAPGVARGCGGFVVAASDHDERQYHARND